MQSLRLDERDRVVLLLPGTAAYVDLVLDLLAARWSRPRWTPG